MRNKRNYVYPNVGVHCKEPETYEIMTRNLLLHKEKNSHRTNGTFAFAPTLRTNPTQNQKSHFLPPYQTLPYE
jgi:hypothetical protein